MTLETNKFNTFIISTENRYYRCIHNLAHSKDKGLKGFNKREILSRIAGVAYSIFSAGIFFLKLAAGLYDLAEGTFHLIRMNKSYGRIFSIERAITYFESLGKSTLGIPFGSLIHVVNPRWGNALFKPIKMEPVTDEVLPRTRETVVDKLYDSLEVLDDVLRKKNINYILDGGTMLGAVRHKGLIPWDDGANIGILDGDIQNLLDACKEFDKREYYLAKWWGGYRLCKKDGKPQQDVQRYDPKTKQWVKDKSRFPFVDIFVFEKENDKYVLSSKFSDSKKIWPNEYFTDEEWLHVTDVPFGHLNLKGLKPKHAQEYLKRDYGDDWNKVAYKNWDHERDGTYKQVKVAILDRSHPVHSVEVEGTKIDHQTLATNFLNEMEVDKLDNNWNLDKLFGSIRVINMNKSPKRLKNVKKYLKQVGLSENQYKRFVGIDGSQLDKNDWSRMTSNYKHISTITAKGREKLDCQHRNQTGCYMSHYRLIKKIAEKYDEARENLLKLQKGQLPHTQLEKATQKVKKYSNVLILEDDNAFGMIKPEDVTKKGWRRQVFSEKMTTMEIGKIFYNAMKDLPNDWDMLYFMAMWYEKPKKTHSSYLKKLGSASCLNAYAVNAKMYPVILNKLRKIEHSNKKLRAVDEEIAELLKKRNCYVIAPAIALQAEGDSTIVKRNEQCEGQELFQCLT
ncbi:MAG: hypothetical protein K940chlam3_01433 [Chlamydiae bacterium]|nr:hypothetical protein [Chlamydiota bacterium]